MAGKKKKVFVALSGGVDSSTAAALLLREGFDCEGVFVVSTNESHRAQEDAGEVAEKLGIKLHVLDLRRDFEQVFDYFCSEYNQGRTPNPCVYCNRHIKFGKLLGFARDTGCDFLAAGHYATISRQNGQVGLYEAANAEKDQSYVLSMIDRNTLPYIILPMGHYSKDQTRELAAEFGLTIAQKAESQEICFIPDGDYVGVLERRCRELARKGDIVDSSGKILGQHNGTHRFTIGQRRGLRVAMGKPYYVVKIDAEHNTIVLGPAEELMHRKFEAAEVNWLADKPTSDLRAKVKIRYNDNGRCATVVPQDNRAIVEFDKPRRAITPGQLAAFYVDEGGKSRLVGGGWIDKVVD
jgi:tRNA-specific 2-thiouridylase